MKHPLLLLAFCLAAARAAAVPVINEFLAVNHGPTLDEFAETSDWIEIKNPGPGSVNLAGWTLTDEPDLPAKWVFPAVTLEENALLLVYASGRDRRIAGQTLHTNFTLSGSGEFLALYSPGNVAASLWQPYPKQFSGISYGTITGGQTQGYFVAPTPGAENAANALTDYVRDTHFDRERFFYSTPFQLTITCDTPGAEIRYTTDSSEPTETSTLYTAPLAINTTTVLRVRAFKAGLVPSNIDTQSYIFAATWRTQPALPAGYSSTWGQAPSPFQAFKNKAVYAMSTAITNHADYSALILPSLTNTLPVLCITGDRNELLGDAGLHGDLRYSEDFEVPVSVEFFNPHNSGEHFSARGALQAHGGAVRDHAKKAFRIDFTGGSGDGPLNFPLFAGSQSESFDQLVLRGGGHDAFSAPGRDNSINDLDIPWHASYLRDQFLRRTEIAAGLLSPRGRYVHLCINGLYWGLYDMHERPNAEFCATNGGAPPEAWDVLHHSNFTGGSPQVVDGESAAWDNLQALCTAPVATNAAYLQLAALLGPDRFIDHMLLRMWSGDYDWLGPIFDPNITQNVSAFFTKNWYAVRASRAVPAGPWQFFTWDGEMSMGSHLLPELINTRNDILAPAYFQRKLDLDLTRIDRANTPAAAWAALRGHPEFRSKVADRARRLLDNSGVLSVAAAQARLNALIQELDLAIVAESARWAGVSGNKAGRNLGNWTSSPIMTRNAHWRPETDWLRDTFVVQRRDIFRNQLKAQNLYPATEPVTVTPFGGQIGPAAPITLTAPDGTIYYTTDGSDPRQPLTALVAPAALVYDAGNPPVTGGVSPFTVKTRAFTGEWSPLTEVTFTSSFPPTPAALTITEIHYHPADPSPAEITAGFTDADDFEFLEITNISEWTVALESLRFAAGVDFDFAVHSTVRDLAAGASLVIASNAAAFQMRYGFAPAGAFANSTRLSNSGEHLKLVTAAGVTIAELTYNDADPWPEAADGTGRSLELLAPLSGTAEADDDNWRASTPVGGTPGTLGGISYAAWLGDYFTAAEIADPLITGALANPEGDGVANLTEYAVRTNPRKSSNHPVKMFVFPNGTATFSYELRADATDITGTLEISKDMQTWTTATEGPLIHLSTTATTHGTVQHNVACAVLPPFRFARLKVTMTP